MAIFIELLKIKKSHTFFNLIFIFLVDCIDYGILFLFLFIPPTQFFQKNSRKPFNKKMLALSPMLTKLAWMIHLRMYTTGLASDAESDLHFQVE